MKQKVNSILLVFGLAFALITQAYAQSEKLTLQEAIDEALKNNIKIKKGENNLIVASSYGNASRFSFAPRVGANLSAGMRSGNSFNQQQGEVVNGVFSNISGSISAEMDLFGGFEKINTMRSYQKQIEARRYDLQFTEQQIMQEVANNYLQVLVRSEQLNIARQNLEFQNNSHEKIKTEVELGGKAAVDEYNQTAFVRSAELEVLRAEIGLKNSKAALLMVMRLDPSTDISLAPPNPPDALLASNEGFESLNNQALENRNDLKYFKEMESSGKFDLMVARSDFMPTLTARAGVGSNYNNIQGYPNRSFEQQFFGDNTYLGASLNLYIPIFNGMRNQAQYVRSKIMYENSKLDRENTEFTITSEVLNAYQNYNDAVLSYQLAVANMEAAEQAYNYNKESYDLGLINIIEFSKANSDYFKAKSDLVGAKYTLMFQDIFLKSVLGTLEAEDL